VVRVTLIVVSGAPGTGKSTVAAALAGELRWPLLALDMIKETLADVLGLEPPAIGRRDRERANAPGWQGGGGANSGAICEDDNAASRDMGLHKSCAPPVRREPRQSYRRGLWEDERWSDRLGDAAAEVVFRLSMRFPDAIAEGWWRGTRRARAVEQFAGADEVFCYCDPGLVTARMRSRHGKERHPIHRDVINPSSILLGHAEMLAGVVSPLGLGGTLIKVDTGQPGAAAAAVAAVTAGLC
jgi:ATPase family associated with various cellular activities (AAA)